MTVGADLVLLAVDEHRGPFKPTHRLSVALAGAELVDLARARRIEASTDTRVSVTDTRPTGDPVLDATLRALSSDSERLLMTFAVALYLPNRVEQHVSALLESGELRGRQLTMNLDGPPSFGVLHLADPRRRAELTDRLSAAADGQDDLAVDAFGALAHIAGLSVAPWSWSLRRPRRLRNLADWFGDTWRYLPGCPPELVLGPEDLAPGQIHPAEEEPWRLAIRLAVQEARNDAASSQRPRRRTTTTAEEQDVQDAHDLDWADRNGL